MRMRAESHIAYIIVIIALIAALLLEKRCNEPHPSIAGNNGTITSVTHIEHRDTGSHSVYPIYIDRTDTVMSMDIVNVTDTVYIDKLKKDYNMARAYHRSFSDTNIAVRWIDTIRMNTLKGSSAIEYRWLRPVTVIMPNPENPLPELRNKVFGGIGIGYEGEIKTNLSLLLITKKDNGYSFSNNLIGKQPNATVTFYRKISFRKVK